MITICIFDIAMNMKVLTRFFYGIKMDIEFHYWVNFIVAMVAGFLKEDAYKIAYSSQLTNYNTKSYTIDVGESCY